MSGVDAGSGGDGGMMEEINEKRPMIIKIGKLEIEPYANWFRGISLGFAIGEGIFYHSIRVEVTVLVVYFGVHFIWDNPEGYV